MAMREYVLTSFLGLNTETSNFLLKDNEASDLANVDVDYRGYLRNRPGIDKVNDTAITSSPSVLGLYKFYKDALDDPLFICGAGSKLYCLDGSDVWQDISGATGYAGARWNFISHKNSCYAANDTDTPQIITASNSTLSATDWSVASVYDPAIKAPFIIEHRDRIFMAGGELAGNGTSKASRVMYTDEEDPPDIDATGLTGIRILEGDGQKITGLSKLGFNLIIFKKHQIHHISGCSVADFVRRQIVSGKGSFANRSLANTGNTIIMVHDSGILNFNGTTIQDLSVNFKTKIDGINSDYIQNACGIHYNKRYWLSYTPNSSTTQDKTLVLDTISGACTEYEYGVNAFYLDLANNLYGACNSGFVRQLDTGTDDDGSNIVSYWQSKYFDFGLPNVTKRIKECVVYCALASEDLTFRFDVDQERRNWSKTITPVLATMKECRFSCGKELVGKRFRLKISHTGVEEFKVWQIIFRYETIDRRGTI